MVATQILFGIFTAESWGNDPIWGAYSSSGLKPPPTRYELVPLLGQYFFHSIPLAKSVSNPDVCIKWCLPPFNKVTEFSQRGIFTTCFQYMYNNIYIYDYMMYNMYIVQYTYININIYLYYLSNPLFSISYVSLSFHPPQLKTLLAGSPETGQPWKFPQESWHYIHLHVFMCVCIYIYIYLYTWKSKPPLKTNGCFKWRIPNHEIWYDACICIYI